MITKEKKWSSGINPKSNMSYEQYIKTGLEMICPQLSVRVYKLAPKNEYPTFERGRDLRVQVYWNKESKYEFIVDKVFFQQSNRNKEDRSWMRNHADVHLKMFADAITKKTKKKTKKKAVRKKKSKIGSTQVALDEVKNNNK